jgi:hypothetical protein
LSSKKPKKSKPKKAVKKKSSVQKKKIARSLSRRETLPSLSSYETWLDGQVRQRVKHPVAESKVKTSEKLPADTFQTWLGKQRVTEKQSRATSAAPRTTYEEWIQRQVAARQSKPEEERIDTQGNVEKVSEALAD